MFLNGMAALPVLMSFFEVDEALDDSLDSSVKMLKSLSVYMERLMMMFNRQSFVFLRVPHDRTNHG